MGRGSKVHFADGLTEVQNLSDSELARGRDLLRTVPAFPPPPPDEADAGGARAADEAPLSSYGAELWEYPDDDAASEPPPAPAAAKAKAAPKAAAKGAAAEPPPEQPGPLEAQSDPDAGALLLSHTWDPPGNWSKYFAAQTFAEAKSLQVETALKRAAQRRLARTGEFPRVWLDCASFPDSVDPQDHPREQVEYGPFKMPVRELKQLFSSVPSRQDGYSVLSLKKEVLWEGTMQTRKFDEQGRPLRGSVAEEVSWEILPGWYHVISAKVVAEDKMSPEMAAEKDEFEPRAEQLRQWCTRQGLRDDVWVELVLGTLRAECLLTAHAMLALHGGMIAVVAWNYFDRLWPLCEWAIFCLRHGAERVQLAADAWAAARVELHRGVRRLSVEGAVCRDPRDRPLLLELLASEFSLEAREEKKGFHKPAATHGLVPIVELVVDFAPVERYARATALGLFAHEAALSASRQLHCDDEGGWCELTKVLVHDASADPPLLPVELLDAMKKCKPFDWSEAAKRVAANAELPSDDGDEADPVVVRFRVEEKAYLEKVEDWWTTIVLPVLEDERRRAARGGRSLE